MSRDLLRRKRDQLQGKADEFETLLASSPVAIGFAQDPECATIVHNATMNRLFGESGLPGPGLQLLVDGVVLTREQMPLQRAATFGEVTTDLELEIRLTGRPPTFVLCNAVPLLDENGRPRGAIAAALDITERKIAEARLIEAEQRLRESQRLVDLAQESGQVGFFHYRMQDDVLAWTPGQAKLFGMDSAEIEAISEWTSASMPPTGNVSYAACVGCSPSGEKRRFSNIVSICLTASHAGCHRACVSFMAKAAGRSTSLASAST